MSYTLQLERTAHWLRVQVVGATRTLEDTVDAWRRIAAEIRAEPPPALLVVSDVQGEPFTMAQVEAFLQSVHGLGFEGLRVAYVYPRTPGWLEVETAGILALEAGFEARAFAHEDAARLWLRHGER